MFCAFNEPRILDCKPSSRSMGYTSTPTNISTGLQSNNWESAKCKWDRRDEISLLTTNDGRFPEMVGTTNRKEPHELRPNEHNLLDFVDTVWFTPDIVAWVDDVQRRFCNLSVIKDASEAGSTSARAGYVVPWWTIFTIAVPKRTVPFCEVWNTCRFTELDDWPDEVDGRFGLWLTASGRLLVEEGREEPLEEGGTLLTEMPVVGVSRCSRVWCLFLHYYSFWHDLGGGNWCNNGDVLQ